MWLEAQGLPIDARVGSWVRFQYEVPANTPGYVWAFGGSGGYPEYGGLVGAYGTWLDNGYVLSSRTQGMVGATCIWATSKPVPGGNWRGYCDTTDGYPGCPWSSQIVGAVLVGTTPDEQIAIVNQCLRECAGLGPGVTMETIHIPLLGVGTIRIDSARMFIHEVLSGAPAPPVYTVASCCAERRGVVVAVGLGASGATSQALVISVNRAAMKPGSPWSSATLCDVDKGSKLGLAFLPDGTLMVAYTVGGANVCRTNLSMGDAGYWSGAEAFPASPSMLNAGNDGITAWKVRTG
ncbi:MAG: hypothetical protein NT029_08320 [Armatimonadetes bacterium]|nr:hypothetical protein [Armatimonadota bacterium]